MANGVNPMLETKKPGTGCHPVQTACLAEWVQSISEFRSLSPPPYTLIDDPDVPEPTNGTDAFPRPIWRCCAHA